jgi:(2Fe-2S) ferredoxin
MTTPASYYTHHIFFCQNERPADAPRPCCAAGGAEHAAKHVKNRVKELGLSGCEEGPCAVVYPEGVWYHYVDEHDLDEIVDSHLKNGVPVARLRLPDVAPE